MPKGPLLPAPGDCADNHNACTAGLTIRANARKLSNPYQGFQSTPLCLNFRLAFKIKRRRMSEKFRKDAQKFP
jgi:hypothetical protein